MICYSVEMPSTWYCQGCGSWEVSEPGVYRARIDIVPTHLAGFLGDDPDTYIHEFPWVYTNPLHIAD